jgi:hypothetical protein
MITDFTFSLFEPFFVFLFVRVFCADFMVFSSWSVVTNLHNTVITIIVMESSPSTALADALSAAAAANELANGNGSNGVGGRRGPRKKKVTPPVGFGSSDYPRNILIFYFRSLHAPISLINLYRLLGWMDGRVLDLKVYQICN